MTTPTTPAPTVTADALADRLAWHIRASWTKDQTVPIPVLVDKDELLLILSALRSRPSEEQLISPAAIAEAKSHAITFWRSCRGTIGNDAERMVRGALVSYQVAIDAAVARSALSKVPLPPATPSQPSDPSARIRELEMVCHELYQVIGVLAEPHGDMNDDPQVIKALDNASDMRLTHKDLLPFTLPSPQPTDPSAYAAGFEACRAMAKVAAKVERQNREGANSFDRGVCDASLNIQERISSLPLPAEAGGRRESIESLLDALRPFALYHDLNDCDELLQDGAIEVPISDLRRARDALRSHDALPTPSTQR